jgi:hypothetical protein
VESVVEGQRSSGALASSRELSTSTTKWRRADVSSQATLVHVGDPILKSNLTRRVDFALFMVEALTNDELIHEAPAIVGCKAPSALPAAAA